MVPSNGLNAPLSRSSISCGEAVQKRLIEDLPADLLVKVKMFSTALLSLLPLASALYQNGSVIAPCDSPIYCQGEILKEIELARPFEDSKTFVDLYVSSLRLFT